MPAFSYNTAQYFQAALTEIVNRVVWIKLDVQATSYGAYVTPSDWVVGVDSSTTLQMGGTYYSGFAVVAVYTRPLNFQLSAYAPSYLRFLDAGSNELFSLQLTTLPYQSYADSFYIPPGALRIALYVATPYSPEPTTAYF